MKYLYLFIILFFLFSCSEHEDLNSRDYENVVLSNPIPGAVGFLNQNDSLVYFNGEFGNYGYLFFESFNDSINNGFAGPFTKNNSFRQLLRLAINGNEEWKLKSQECYNGRIVQHAEHGSFHLEQSVIFYDSIISIFRYSIKNIGKESLELNPEWHYMLNDDFTFNANMRYPVLFSSESADLYIHTSGIDSLQFNSDSLHIVKRSNSVKLHPNESANHYAVIVLVEHTGKQKRKKRIKPWTIFPEEEFAANAMHWGRKILEE